MSLRASDLLVTVSTGLSCTYAEQEGSGSGSGHQIMWHERPRAGLQGSSTVGSMLNHALVLIIGGADDRCLSEITWKCFAQSVLDPGDETWRLHRGRKEFRKVWLRFWTPVDGKVEHTRVTPLWDDLTAVVEIVSSFVQEDCDSLQNASQFDASKPK